MPSTKKKEKKDKKVGRIASWLEQDWRKIFQDLMNAYDIPFKFTLLLFASISLWIHFRINEVQPRPYMDEIFHVPQSQKYCRGLFKEWDPKITTLPGTYIVSTVVLAILNLYLSVDDLCSTFNLRLFNVGVSVFNLYMIFSIIGHYYPETSKVKRALSALNVATFPILYFFSFLYYTDAVSTSFILLMHFLYLKRQFGFSALAGGLAVLTRQTNIVWVFYHGVVSILGVLTETFEDNDPLDDDEPQTPPVSAASTPSKAPTKSTAKSTTSGKKGKKRVKGSKKFKKYPRIPMMYRIWRECWIEFAVRGYGYALVGAIFLGFVVYNGSVVVGDKDAHKATVNFPQVGYFALVFGFFTLPYMMFRIKPLVEGLLDNPFRVITAGLIFAFMILINSPAHPYLLADNRHYTFYIWKRYFAGAPCYPFLWIPVYIIGWFFLYQNVGLRDNVIYSYILCTVINIVPQLLMEFRYFIPAYLYARMTFQDCEWRELLLEFSLNLAVNFFTLYIFINKPFTWPDSTDIQRFMW